jgi:hypothetical protein
MTTEHVTRHPPRGEPSPVSGDIDYEVPVTLLGYPMFHAVKAARENVDGILWITTIDSAEHRLGKPSEWYYQAPNSKVRGIFSWSEVIEQGSQVLGSDDDPTWVGEVTTITHELPYEQVSTMHVVREGSDHDHR